MIGLKNRESTDEKQRFISPGKPVITRGTEITEKTEIILSKKYRNQKTAKNGRFLNKKKFIQKKLCFLRFLRLTGGEHEKYLFCNVSLLWIESRSGGEL